MIKNGKRRIHRGKKILCDAQVAAMLGRTVSPNSSAIDRTTESENSEVVVPAPQVVKKTRKEQIRENKAKWNEETNRLGGPFNQFKDDIWALVPRHKPAVVNESESSCSVVSELEPDEVPEKSVERRKSEIKDGDGPGTPVADRTLTLPLTNDSVDDEVVISTQQSTSTPKPDHSMYTRGRSFGFDVSAVHDGSGQPMRHVTAGSGERQLKWDESGVVVDESGVPGRSVPGGDGTYVVHRDAATASSEGTPSVLRNHTFVMGQAGTEIAKNAETHEVSANDEEEDMEVDATVPEEKRTPRIAEEVENQTRVVPAQPLPSVANSEHRSDVGSRARVSTMPPPRGVPISSSVKEPRLSLWNSVPQHAKTPVASQEDTTTSSTVRGRYALPEKRNSPASIVSRLIKDRVTEERLEEEKKDMALLVTPKSPLLPNRVGGQFRPLAKTPARGHVQHVDVPSSAGVNPNRITPKPNASSPGGPLSLRLQKSTERLSQPRPNKACCSKQCGDVNTDTSKQMKPLRAAQREMMTPRPGLRQPVLATPSPLTSGRKADPSFLMARDLLQSSKVPRAKVSGSRLTSLKTKAVLNFSSESDTSRRQNSAFRGEVTEKREGQLLDKTDMEEEDMQERDQIRQVVIDSESEDDDEREEGNTEEEDDTENLSRNVQRMSMDEEQGEEDDVRGDESSIRPISHHASFDEGIGGGDADDDVFDENADADDVLTPGPASSRKPSVDSPIVKKRSKKNPLFNFLNDSSCSVGTPGKYDYGKENSILEDTLDTSIIEESEVIKEKDTREYVLAPRKLIKADETREVKTGRPQRNRIPPVRRWLGEQAVYVESPNGGVRLTGVNEVVLKDKDYVKYGTADFVKLNDKRVEEKNRRITRKKAAEKFKKAERAITEAEWGRDENDM